MRISDWSSDVCSSDLFGLIPPTTGALALFGESDATFGGKRGFDGKGTAGQQNVLSGEISVTVAQVYPNGTMLVQGQKRVTLQRGDALTQIKGIVRTAEIGSASGRERVCQSVELSGVAVSLQKNNETN